MRWSRASPKAGRYNIQYFGYFEGAGKQYRIPLACQASIVTKIFRRCGGVTVPSYLPSNPHEIGVWLCTPFACWVDISPQRILATSTCSLLVASKGGILQRRNQSSGWHPSTPSVPRLHPLALFRQQSWAVSDLPILVFQVGLFPSSGGYSTPAFQP